MSPRSSASGSSGGGSDDMNASWRSAVPASATLSSRTRVRTHRRRLT